MRAGGTPTLRRQLGFAARPQGAAHYLGPAAEIAWQRCDLFAAGEPLHVTERIGTASPGAIGKSVFAEECRGFRSITEACPPWKVHQPNPKDHNRLVRRRENVLSGGSLCL